MLVLSIVREKKEAIYIVYLIFYSDNSNIFEKVYRKGLRRLLLY